jgi:hypothetical protein
MGTEAMYVACRRLTSSLFVVGFPLVIWAYILIEVAPTVSSETPI